MMPDKLTRREFVKHASIGIGASAFGLQGCSRFKAGAAKPKPNILFVFADQMRASAMRCMGNPDVKTPHLDRLASQGMLLTNAYSCTPVCTPYRAQLLTGRYGHATGVNTNDTKLPPEEITLAEVLKSEGYSTGYIGKWHLNAGRVSNDPLEKSGYVRPEDRQGFDYWAALECSHNYYETCYFGDGAKPISIHGYEPDVQTDLAIEFMSRNKDKPFCLLLSFGPPHNPYKPPERSDIYDPDQIHLRHNVPDEFAAKARATIAWYYGLVTSLDDNIGRMMQALYELGIAGDTIFCFSSDHGDMLYSHGHQLKQRPWEESANVPFIVRYSREIDPGQKSDLLLGSVDIMPTLLGFCGAPIPKKVQGADLSGAIAGKGGREPDAVYFTNQNKGGGPGPDWRGIRAKEWKYAFHSEGDWVLYNLADDPYEMTNLANDPRYRNTRDELRGMIEEWQKETGDDLPMTFRPIKSITWNPEKQNPKPGETSSRP